jgi:hypothetical protein
VKSHGYIVSAVYDWAFFLLAPLLALGFGIGVSGTAFGTETFHWINRDTTMSELVVKAVVHAHLIAVVFRSHGNAKIRKLHPYRFFAVPVFLYIAMLGSMAVFIVATVVATFWDVYHSSLQTFGFARIYDMKLGNDPEAGRRLDQGLNLLLYAGPILGGASLMDHIETFESLEHLGSPLARTIPFFFTAHSETFTWLVVGLGSGFMAWYLHSYWELHRHGYRISPQKVFLLATTGLVSIYSWGFNTWGQAYLIMNAFHALQYFAIVWAFERGNLGRLFRTESLGPAVTVTVFMGICLVYGVAVQSNTIYAFAALSVVVSLMHFWYDGFIWSVRKDQV